MCVARWEALGWPHKIHQTVDKTLAVLEEDEERFAKLQAADSIAFEERLSGIAVRGPGQGEGGGGGEGGTTTSRPTHSPLLFFCPVLSLFLSYPLLLLAHSPDLPFP